MFYDLDFYSLSSHLYLSSIPSVSFHKGKRTTVAVENLSTEPFSGHDNDGAGVESDL